MTVDRMMKTVAKAYLATGKPDAVAKLRSLSIKQLQETYAWAVVELSHRQLLSPVEQADAQQHERDWLDESAYA